MKKILSNPKGVAISILGSFFLIQEVSLFAAAVTFYFQRPPLDEIGSSLLVTVVLITLALVNLIAFSLIYFYLRKLLKLEIHSALLWALFAAVVALLLGLFAFRSREDTLHYFFGSYASVVGFVTLMRIYARIKGNDVKPST